MTTKHIVGISGSLRNNSLNTALLLNAKEMLPSEYTFTLADISALPLYNQELEGDLPQSVKDLAELCHSADGFLISTPEYNGSISGSLKNALDWMSRQFVGTPLALKPVAVMGATPGFYGTSRAQTHLRDILLYLNMDAVTRPELLIGQAHQKFDESMNFTDDMGKQFMQQLMDKFVTKVESAN
ncbi:NADPH-dependent FMN reductase [Paenibacillus marinisediminis]